MKAQGRTEPHKTQVEWSQRTPRWNKTSRSRRQSKTYPCGMRSKADNDEEVGTQLNASADRRGMLLRRGNLRRVWHQRERWEDIEPKTLFRTHTRRARRPRGASSEALQLARCSQHPGRDLPSGRSPRMQTETARDVTQRVHQWTRIRKQWMALSSGI
jgi:hypothetical protein